MVEDVGPAVDFRFSSLASTHERRLPRPVLTRAIVLGNELLQSDYWRLTLDAPDLAERAQPGQFAMLTIARQDAWLPILPRPMAIYRWDRAAGSIEIVYRVVGEGTSALTTWRGGEPMTVVGPLGTGFQLRPASQTVLLLGRGIGTCSLTALAMEAAAAGVSVFAVASGRSPEAMVGSTLYGRGVSVEVVDVTDSDGSSDPRALRGQLLARFAATRPDQIFVCGSERLLHLAVELGERFDAEVQVSVEAHMACGLGYCHGCSSGAPGLAEEAPLVCAAGPAFSVSRDARA